MKKRKGNLNKIILTTSLVFAMVASPIYSNVAWAENVEKEETDIVQEIEDKTDVLDAQDETVVENETTTEQEPAETNEAAEEEVTDVVEPQQASLKLTRETSADIVQDFPKKLVYGDENLADKDAFILLILGDGFTKEEQDKFFNESKIMAEYVMDTSPYDEFTDVIKIYAIGVESKESGAKADKAINQEQADQDTRDTYFGAAFWTGGMQRLVAVDRTGQNKANAIKKEHLPEADFSIILVNSDTYGGSGGSICVLSLNSESRETMLHELGHTAAGLSDEYFAGASYAGEFANMTAESDPEKVRWNRFIGKNGVGVYEYDNGGDGWYRPHENCKMRFLGKQYEFCEVCKEEHRKAFAQHSNVTKMSFQPYADLFFEAEEGKDMSEYFIIRKGKNETTGDKIGDGFTLEYFTADGTKVDGIPSKRGTYTMKATYAGNSTYDACSVEARYTIAPPDLIELKVNTKVYDGKPAELNYTVDYDKEYEVKAHYTGVIPYAAEITYQYDSDEAPIVPGRYTVELTVYDKETGELLSKKSADYTINFKSTTIYNHDTGEYPGAMPYYNNKTIVFAGEGFTADEQDKFEKIAKEYIEYFRNTEPYKEADLYFNYHTVETVSEESGISTDKNKKDTYFDLSLDSNGKINFTDDSTAGAMYIGNNVITSYYKATIVIVNDDAVKENSTFTNKRFTVYSGSNEAGMEFAASELLNYFTSQPEGYRAGTEAEIDKQRTEFLKSLYYTWYGWDYAPILSRAYNEKFVENGTAFDMSEYFYTYVLGTAVDDVSYTMTYYKDNNGVKGEKLDGAPSEAGKYFAQADLILDEGQSYKTVTVGNVDYYIPKSRGLVAYEIKKEEADKPSEGGDEGDKPTDKPDTKPDDKPNKKPDAKPNKDKNNGNIKTGDQSPITLYVSFMVLALAGILAIIKSKKYADR